MSIQPIAEHQREIEESPQVSPSLCVAPVEGESLARSLIANKLSNPLIAGDNVRKLPLLPKLLQHR